MTTKKINQILEGVLERVNPEVEELKELENYLKEFLERFKKESKKLKIDVEAFVGGSFAKKTVIKKNKYDVDVFLRFDKKYPDKELTDLARKILEKEKNLSVVHGSRDYFLIKLNKKFSLELVPVKKVNRPKDAENITDLSYSHVKFINKKVKSQKSLDEIKIAKAFCHANNCYGAESYIKGFSGYALELLVYHYGSFVKFIRAVSKFKGEKIIVDSEKHYKNKQQIMMDLNSSKLESPIVLIDPTYKQRNAAAALSLETLERFKRKCEKFLKNPSEKDFEIEKTNLEKIKAEAKKKKYEFVLIETSTNKQEGDIAGSKLLKFYNHLSGEIEKYFEIKNKGFNYNELKSARYFFVVESKGELTLSGPNSKDLKNVQAFKKEHKKTFVKKGKLYAKKKINFGLNKFLIDWIKKRLKRMKEMNITSMKIIK